MRKTKRKIFFSWEVEKESSPNTRTTATQTVYTATSRNNNVSADHRVSPYIRKEYEKLIIVIIIIFVLVIVGHFAVVSNMTKTTRSETDKTTDTQVYRAEGELFWYNEPKIGREQQSLTPGHETTLRTYGKKFKFNLGGYRDCFEVKKSHGWITLGSQAFGVEEYSTFRRKLNCKHEGKHILQVWNQPCSISIDKIE